MVIEYINLETVADPKTKNNVSVEQPAENECSALEMSDDDETLNKEKYCRTTGKQQVCIIKNNN